MGEGYRVERVKVRGKYGAEAVKYHAFITKWDEWRSVGAPAPVFYEVCVGSCRLKRNAEAAAASAAASEAARRARLGFQAVRS